MPAGNVGEQLLPGEGDGVSGGQTQGIDLIMGGWAQTMNWVHRCSSDWNRSPGGCRKGVVN